MSAGHNFKSSIDALVHEIPARFLAPRRSMTFYTHLSIGVIGCGGFGIWYVLDEARKHGFDWMGTTAALLTYFPAIVATALLDIQQDLRPYWRAFGIFCLLPFGLLFYFSVSLECVGWRFFWALAASIMSIVLWCVANGEKECFKDLQMDAPTPPPTTPAAGSTAGWQT